MRIPKPSRLAAALAAAHLLAAALPAWANPVNPSVVAGSAAFAQHGKLLSITNSPGTIINWGGFSIRADEITRFIQNGAYSAVLNRVTGAESSQLLGQLLSNGRVFLINPNGIAIGAGARIDTAGFIASSLNMSNADFLSGRLRFEAAGNPAAVTNHGVIVGNGGLVALIGGDVQNHGNVSAGQVALAAGRKVELLDTASPNIRVQVEGGLDQTNLNRVLQAGTISAALPGGGDAVGARIEGGRVLLVAAGDVTATSGSDTLAKGSTGGTVLAYAQGGNLQVGGRIDAVGSGGSGGGIDLLGRRIDVQAGAVVDASGTHDGGQIRVGGDYQGRNAAIANASQTRIEAGATLRADARESGDGGRIIAWADGATAASGSISARGGAQAGNGGFVEVSGKGVLHFDGRVDTTAPRGNAGTLLLDPANVTITNTADAFAGGSFAAGEFGGATGTSTITWGTLETQLIAGNVVVTTSGGGGAGNLTLSGSRTYNSPHNLSFLAHNDVSLGAGGFVVNNGSGGLTFVAGWDGASVASPAVTSGTGNMGIGWGFQSGGALKFQAGGTIAAGTYNNGSEFLRSTGSTLSLLAGGNIDLNNNPNGPATDTLRSAGLMTISSTNGHVINSRQVHLNGTGGIAISAGTNIGNVTTGGNMGSLSATGTGANIALTAGTAGAGGIRYDGVAISADNNIAFSAVDRINFANTVPVTATNGNLSLTSSAADIVQTAGGVSTFTAGGNITVNAVTGVAIGNLSAGSGGDGVLTVTNTGASSDVNVGGLARANKAGLAANQFAVDISSARDLNLSSFNNGTTTGVATLSTGGMRFVAARNVDLNTNGGGPGSDTYTSSGDLVITATAGQIFNSRLVNLAGKNVTLTAATHIGNVTTGANLGSLTATGTGSNLSLTAGTTGGGGIRIGHSGAITAANNVTMQAVDRIDFTTSTPVTATSGNLSLTSSAADIVQTFGGASSLTAGGNVTVSAVTGVSFGGGMTAGSGGDGTLTVTSTGAGGDVALGLSRATKAGLATNQYAIDVSSGRDINLNSFNNGTTNAVSSLTTGGMRFVAARDINLNNNCCGPGSDTYTSAGDLVVTATAGQIFNNRLVNLAGKNVTLTAGTHIGNVTTGANLGSLTATGTGSNLSLTAGTTGSGGIRIGHSGALTAANNLTMQAVDRIEFTTSTPVTATSGNLSLTSSAADIVQTFGGASSLTAGANVSVSAVTGVSFGGGMTAGSGGDGVLTITSTGAGGDVALGLSRATKAGLAGNQYAIDVSSGRDINLNSFNNGTTNAVSSLATGGMRFVAARDINLNNNCCGPGTDTYTSAGDFVLTATGGQITQGRTVNLSGNRVYLNANTAINVTGSVTAPDTISYSLTNSDLTVSALTATNVILNSTNGAILDGNGGTTNVTATTLTATARTGINLDTNVGSLSASNSGTGAVALREADGATVTGLGTTAGTVTLTTAGGTLTNTGTVTLPGGATISGAFANQGTLNITGGTADFGTAAFGMDGGTVNVSGGATLSKAGGTFTWNDGTLAGTGTYTLPTVALGGSGARVLNGPTINAGATTLSSGSLTVQNGTFNAAGNTSIGAGTVLDVTGGSFVQSGVLFDVAGTVRMSGGALGANTLALTPGGRLEGTGTLTGNLNNASGTVAPGASPGLLTVTGNYTQGPAATLAIELAGTTAGTGFDRVAVGGNASLNGTLAVTIPGPFAPATTDTFRFITTGGTRSGNFSATTLPTGFAGAVAYGANFADLGFTSVPAVAPTTTASAAPTTRATNAPTSSSDTLVAINRLNIVATTEVASEEETDDAAVLVCR